MITPKELARWQNGVVLIWRDVDSEEEVAAARLSEFSSMTVTIDGGPAQLLGRNEDDGWWWPLTDVHGFQLKAPGIYHVIMRPREVVPAALSATPTTVTISATRG